MVRWELEGEAGSKVKGMTGWFDGNLKEETAASVRKRKGEAGEKVKGMTGWFGGNLKEKRMEK